MFLLESKKIGIFCVIAEADLQQLNHALKILCETEKQLRMSKNQTTWLTVALLQLNSVGPSPDSNESRLCMKTAHAKGIMFPVSVLVIGRYIYLAMYILEQ